MRTTELERCGPQPEWYITLPGRSDVWVIAERVYVGNGQYSPTSLRLIDDGYQDALLRVGVITTPMLAPPGKGHHYRDPNHRNVSITRRWREADGQPVRILKVSRPMELAELPRQFVRGQ